MPLLKPHLGKVLRKRDSIHRHRQLAARSQSRVLPWLRREDMGQAPGRAKEGIEDIGISSKCSSDSSSVPSTPQQAQWTSGSTFPENHSSPTLSSFETMLEHGTASSFEGSRSLALRCPGLVDYRESGYRCKVALLITDFSFKYTQA